MNVTYTLIDTSSGLNISSPFSQTRKGSVKLVSDNTSAVLGAGFANSLSMILKQMLKSNLKIGNLQSEHKTLSLIPFKGFSVLIIADGSLVPTKELIDDFANLNLMKKIDQNKLYDLEVVDKIIEPFLKSVSSNYFENHEFWFKECESFIISINKMLIGKEEIKIEDKEKITRKDLEDFRYKDEVADFLSKLSNIDVLIEFVKKLFAHKDFKEEEDNLRKLIPNNIFLIQDFFLNIVEAIFVSFLNKLNIIQKEVLNENGINAFSGFIQALTAANGMLGGGKRLAVRFYRNNCIDYKSDSLVWVFNLSDEPHLAR